jgi:spoIIIJ-associated protein
MEPRRFSGKTVEEATDNALEALDANLEDVEIVVVNPGRSGILGFGGEPAEIDVALLDGDSPTGGYSANASESGSGNSHYAPEPEQADQPDPGDEFDDDEEFEDETAEDSDEPEVSVPDVEAEEVQEDADSGEPESVPFVARSGGGRGDRSQTSGDSGGRSSAPERRERSSEPDPEVIEFASEVIDYFLASMSVVADTYIREETDDGVPVFDIEGEDSGLLIGRRGETLQSLQYLVNLIVTHQLGRSAYVQIDIEGYKERRRETLAGVAQRTAERVADSGESAELEPMPAYERRWVHMSLANSTLVRTESSGEGSERFVVIYPGSEGNSSGGNAGNGGRGRRPRSRGGRRGRG